MRWLVCGYLALSSACSNFFSVLDLSQRSDVERAGAKGEGEDDACLLLKDYHSYLEILSSQLLVMNSTMTIVTRHSLTQCVNLQWRYPKIFFVRINPHDLAQEYQIPLTYFAEPSQAVDILKILIAHKFQFAFVELGLHFLSLEPGDYSHMFVSLQIWSHLKCSQQLSNVAFCLSRLALEDLIEEIKEGSPSIDFGTSLFTRILPNRYPLRLYSLNHPEIFTIPEIVADHLDYQHKFLYLPLKAVFADRSRVSSSSSAYLSYLRDVRSAIGFPSLLPALPSPADSLPLFDSLMRWFQEIAVSPSLLFELVEESDLLRLSSLTELILEMAKGGDSSHRSWSALSSSVESRTPLDLLEKVREILLFLSEHPQPTIRRRCLQLLLLVDAS
jgi:hypothetical protein